MSQTNQDYINTLVERIKGLKNPTEGQQLIVRYNDKETLAKEEQSLFNKLIHAEKKAEQYEKAKADVRKALNAEKTKERKEDTQRKIIVGGSLIAGATKGNNTEYYQKVMKKMLEDRLLGDRDKEKYQQILNKLPKPPHRNR